jgi:Protein of unknown function (DUF1236)
MSSVQTEESVMGPWLGRSLIALVFACGMTIAAAQDSPPANTPDLHLTQAQKQTIYQSVTSQKDKTSSAPDTFRAAVGANVPDSVKLAPMPKTIVDLMPQIKDFEFGLVANQVLIVDPKSRRVVEVINGSNG